MTPYLGLYPFAQPAGRASPGYLIVFDEDR